MSCVREESYVRKLQNYMPNYELKHTDVGLYENNPESVNIRLNMFSLYSLPFIMEIVNEYKKDLSEQEMDNLFEKVNKEYIRDPDRILENQKLHSQKLAYTLLFSSELAAIKELLILHQMRSVYCDVLKRITYDYRPRVYKLFKINVNDFEQKFTSFINS